MDNSGAKAGAPGGRKGQVAGAYGGGQHSVSAFVDSGPSAVSGEEGLMSKTTGVLLCCLLGILTLGTGAIALVWCTDLIGMEQTAGEAAAVLAEQPQEERSLFPEDGRDYYGIVSIPSLELRLPVLAEYREADLKLMPCRYAGEVEEGTLVIVGHNYSAHFGGLRKLEQGDVLAFETEDGSTYRYEVAAIEYLGQTDVDAMLNGDWDLTLYTCSYSETSFLTIRCRLAV